MAIPQSPLAVNGSEQAMPSSLTLSPGERPPKAKGLPILGNALSLLRDPMQFFRDAHFRYGTVYEVRVPGRRLTVLAGLEANRWMGAEGRDLLESGTFWRRLARKIRAPHAIVAMDGPDHMLLRRLYRDDLNARVVEERAERIVELIQALLAKRQPGDTFSCVEFTRQIASLEANLLLTGENSLEQWSDVKALVEYFRWLTNSKVLGKWPGFALLLPQFLRLKRRAQRFVGQVEAKVRRGEVEGFFRSGFEAQKEHPELFTEGDLQAHFMLGYVGGVDTIGVTLAFALRELLRDRELLMRVRRELDAACEENGGELPPPSRLKALPDLMGLCYETLRLYPAAFGMARHAAADFEFEGYQIKKGTEIVVLTTATHVDPEYFPEPYRFDIERYREPRNEHRRKYAYSPYGRGPHVCLGAAMAELMLPLTLATLIRHYELSLARADKEYPTVYDPSTSLPTAFELRFNGQRRLKPFP